MNIDRYRPLVAIVLIGFLVATNVAHLSAYSAGPEAVQAYSAKWDMPQIKGVNLLLLVLLLSVTVVKPRMEESE